MSQIYLPDYDNKLQMVVCYKIFLQKSFKRKQNLCLSIGQCVCFQNFRHTRFQGDENIAWKCTCTRRMVAVSEWRRTPQSWLLAVGRDDEREHVRFLLPYLHKDTDIQTETLWLPLGTHSSRQLLVVASTQCPRSWVLSCVWEHSNWFYCRYIHVYMTRFSNSLTVSLLVIFIQFHQVETGGKSLVPLLRREWLFRSKNSVWC